MNKKAILINVIILGLLIGFVVISITIYYLVHVATSVIKIINQAINDLIGIIGR